MWNYAFTKTQNKPQTFDGQILVPYSPESKLSGVNRQLKSDEFLHYNRVFTLPSGFNKGRILLNFGAVDQVCKVYINGNLTTTHEGGYTAFSTEITPFLNDGENTIDVVVTDDADSDVYGRGKQRYKRGGLWYTATSGIWQTVWLESVPDIYLKSVKLIPDSYKKTLTVIPETNGEDISVFVLDGDSIITQCTAKNGDNITLDVSKCKLWDANNPELYNVKIIANDDEVLCYFGLRSYTTIEKDGNKYFAVNNKPVFYNGLLDQGYFPDGIYTPNDNKMMYEEIKNIKNLGYNMLRKHIKIEPMLWYYYCDILGVYVWQDMVNGGGKYSQLRIMLCPFFNLHINDGNYKKMKRSESSRKQFMIESKQTINQLFNCVSLCLWTPFNEAWGQFDALKVWKELASIDPTRHYDHASGWQDKGGGDVNSKHIYFRKARPKNDKKRVLALTEFGGYSYLVKDHFFTNKKFGYKFYKNAEKLTKDYKKLYEKQIFPLIKKQGLSATVYTQITDVEDEINGIYTYDRVLKMPPTEIIETNKRLYDVFNEVVK